MSGEEERGAAVSIPGLSLGERSAAPSLVVGIPGGATEQHTVIQAYEFEGKDAIGGTMTQTQEVPVDEVEPAVAEPKLLPVPKRAGEPTAAPLSSSKLPKRPPKPSEAPAPSLAAEPQVSAAVAKSVIGASRAAQGSHKMRRSIVAMERTWENRMCGVLLYLVVSGLVSLFTSLDFFTLIGAVPGQPSIAPFMDNAGEFYEFIDNASDVLGRELYSVYNRSLIAQAEDCFAKETLSGAEAARLPNDTANFIDNYCKNLGIRLYNYSISTFGNPYRSQSYRCGAQGKPASALNPTYVNSNNLVWLTNSSQIACDPGTEKVGDRCYWQLFYAIPNASCTDEFDQGYNSRYQFSGSSATILCNYYQVNTMRDFYDTYDADTQFSSFWQAVQNLLTYNENYLAKMLPNIDLIGDLNLKLDVRMQALKLKFQEFNVKINYQHDWMFRARNILVTLRGYGIPITVPSIDLATPSIPDFGDIDLDIGNIDLTLDLFNDYNPPPIVGVSVNLTQFEIPEYKPEFINNITLANSELYNDVIDIAEFLAEFVTNFQRLDLILRFINWLREFGFLLRVVKRDMTTMTAKVKRYLALIFQNAIIFLYVGIFIYASSAFLHFDGFNFDFALAELNVQCENAVYIKNLDKLAKYQGELFLKRSDCNSALSSRNNFTSSINERLITPIIGMANDYEAIYKADNEGLTLSPADSTVNLVNFQLPSADLGSGLYGTLVDEQGVSEIETYSVSSDDCDNSAESKRLTDSLNQVTTEMKYYISGILLITIALIATSRLTSMGLQYFFWMELTRGYAFDTPFTSDTIRLKIRGKKRTAVFMWVMAVGFVLFATCYGRIYLRNKIPSAYD